MNTVKSIITIFLWSGLSACLLASVPMNKGHSLPAPKKLEPIRPEGFVHKPMALKKVDVSTANRHFLGTTRTFENFEKLTPLSLSAGFETDPIHIEYQPPSNAGLAADIQRANELFELVTRENRLTNFLSDGSLASLPIGIDQEIGGRRYIIVIDSMVITPEAAYLVAYMSLDIPQSDQRLAFKGSNIRFTRGGGLTGDVRLELLEDFSFEFNNNTQLTFKSENAGTFVEWDCNGFKSLGVSAEVQFSRDYLVPDNEDGSVGEGRVAGSFSTTINDWNDLVAEVSLQPFQVAKLKGVGFYVNSAVFDFSDINNSPNVVFPEDYESTLMTAENPELWQGFYLKELAIKLPPHLSSKNGGRKQLEAYDLIIDNMGFTGTILARDLLSKEEGSMNGWAFSIDSLGIYVKTNVIEQAGFNGELQVPLFKEDQSFAYTTVITSENDYLFHVENTSTMEMSLWAAEAEIYESSSLEISIVDGKFMPKAVLNGSLTINASLSSGGSGGAGVSLADLAFEQLEVSTVEPYLTVGSFSLGSEALEQKMANLPISLQEIELAGSGNDVNLSFDIVVNLVGSGAGGFGGVAGLNFLGEIDTSGDRMALNYKGVEVSEITVDIDGGAFTLKGSLNIFKEDAIYGNGIKGIVDASFQPGIGVKATALFGTVNGFRYWYADAMATFNPGIMVLPGFGIYGFGGGAYYHMKQTGVDEEGSDIGASSSGIVYVPDEETFLGVKATIALGTHPKPEAFNGDATLEISFNSKGGVNKIIFTGNAYFAAPPLPPNMAKKVKALASASGEEFSNEKGSVYANLHIEFDVPNVTLHGNLKVYVSVAGGVVRGPGNNNLAGEAVLHFSPDEWYIHIGNPDARIGLTVAGLFSMNGYMMVGQNIPPMPAPPSNVTDILGGIDMDRSDDLEKLSTGDGFAFGAGLNYSTGDLRFMMFYGRFDAGAGFDIMLKNYGSEARCSGSTDPIGINGWYASGQAYAFFDGKIGISVDLPFYSGDYDILNIAAAALLRAKLPNPVYLEGTVGGRYSILGGLVKGSCRFQITIGEECEIIGGQAIDGIEMIAEVTPFENANDVSVFNVAQAVFNLPVGEVFEITDREGDTRYFRAKLNEFKLRDNGREVPGYLEWNVENDVVAFHSFEILPPHRDIELSVKVSFEERKGGSWRRVLKNFVPAEEFRKWTFKTGTAPDHIPHSNVVYAYPMIDQYNYYQDEVDAGYIQLNTGQSYLFEQTDQWRKVLRFTSAGGARHEGSFSYNSSAKKVEFILPDGLSNNTIYTISLVNVPTQTLEAVDLNVEASVAQLGSGTGDVELRTRTVTGVLEENQETTFYEAHLRTSHYNTFAAKFNAINRGNGWINPIYPDIHQIGFNIQSNELFDRYEIKGHDEFKRLVNLEADLSNRWFQTMVHPLVYEGYPRSGGTFDHRDIQVLGVPPVRAVYFRQANEDKLVEDVERNSGAVLGTSRSGSLLNDMVFEMHGDYYRLKQKAANLSLSRNDAWITRVLETPFPSIMIDDYNVNVTYRLPGEETGTYNTTVTIRNR